MRIKSVIAGIAIVPSLASAAAPIHLAPSTPWVVDYAENSCRLIRHFGEGEDKTMLTLESEAPGALDMFVVSKRLGTFSGEAPAKFVPLEKEPMRGLLGTSTDRGVPMLLIDRVELLPDDAIAAEEKRQAEQRAHPQVRPPMVSLAEQAERKAQRQAFATGTTAIEIDPRPNHAVILDTGSLGGAIKAFDQCSRDSLRDWGVDPDVEDKIVHPVWAPDLRKWFSPDDYPTDMLLRGQESTVKIRVLVDATGRVTKCTSLSHYKAPEFNKITCDKFTARAHFEPAELADGTKVPSYYVNEIVFRMIGRGRRTVDEKTARRARGRGGTRRAEYSTANYWRPFCCGRLVLPRDLAELWAEPLAEALPDALPLALPLPLIDMPSAAPLSVPTAWPLAA